MNLPALFRRALHVLFPAKSPQRTAEHAKGTTRPAPTPQPAEAESAPRPDLEDKTARIPVEKYRAAVRDRIDQFPPRPAAPRDRGTSTPGPDHVDMWEPHNLPRSRWFK